MKKNGLNVFDKLAKNVSNTKEEKGIAKLSSELKTVVDEIISLKEQLNSLEAILETKSSLLIEHIQNQQEDDARKGEFHKSYVAQGANGKNLLYSSIDKFSVPQDEATLLKIKEVLKDRFETWIVRKREIKLRENVVEDTEKINKLIEALDKAKLNIEDYFNVIDKYVTVKGLDKEKYQLSKEEFKQFKLLVPQVKPSLK